MELFSIRIQRTFQLVSTPGHGNEAGVIFPFPQFFQCFVTIITMYPIRHDGQATAVKAT